MAGKAKSVQCRIKKLTCNVAAERSTGAISPLLSRSQTDNQKARAQVTESGNGEAVPVRITLAEGLQVFRQTRAGNTVARMFKRRHGKNVSMAPMQRDWDIFCRVIDNYGDIGVCWRLARQLAREYALNVRLWVDAPQSLAAMCPALDTELESQIVDGVEIRYWNASFPEADVADVVIEAFACELPEIYVQAMAKAKPAPGWINLEYLTAEAWAAAWHGTASPHPSLALVKYFFFPGFGDASGGLIKEACLFEQRAEFLAVRSPSHVLEVSLFCYETAAVGELLDLLAESNMPVLCHVPPGQPLNAAKAHLGGEGPWQIGLLNVVPIPFLTQDEYDHLLWRCEVNFVRGEDSFVRAIWAGHPFVWQIYKQDEEAHLVKLAAFLDLYTKEMPPELAVAMKSIFIAWNTGIGLPEAWRQFLAMHDQMATHSRKWSNSLAERPNLAANLVKFCCNEL